MDKKEIEESMEQHLVLKQEKKVILNKYGRLRLNYLNEHKYNIVYGIAIK